MYHEIEYRVPYADTDQMGVVYYANYLEYFERSRTEMLRSAGLPYSEMEKRGLFLPVSEAYCKYHAPARCGDLLTLRSCVKEVRGVRMVISSEIRRGEVLLVSGYVVLVSVNGNRKVTRMPGDFVETCKQFSFEPESENE